MVEHQLPKLATGVRFSSSAQCHQSKLKENNNILNKIININKSEIKKVDNFRKLSDTAVLSIMFTDIKDFTLLTEKVGDIKSNHIRKEHDKLFINIITRYKKGEIIKHSGDSFFAIFSEPSEARIMEYLRRKS